jgi:hypothetical protein
VFVEPRFSAKVNGAPIVAKAKSTPFSEARESALNLDLEDFDITPFVVYASPWPFDPKKPLAGWDVVEAEDRELEIRLTPVR